MENCPNCGQDDAGARLPEPKVCASRFEDLVSQKANPPKAWWRTVLGVVLIFAYFGFRIYTKINRDREISYEDLTTEERLESITESLKSEIFLDALKRDLGLDAKTFSIKDVRLVEMPESDVYHAFMTFVYATGEISQHDFYVQYDRETESLHYDLEIDR